MGVSEHGVVALGDSFLTGFGLPVAGLSSSSWAGWLAWSLDSCLTVHAVNGATAEQVVRDQAPRLRGSYRLGAVWFGMNDLARFQADQFRPLVREVLGALTPHVEHAAVTTLPLSARIPRMPWRQQEGLIRALNDCIREVAAEQHVLLVDTERALTGPWSMAPDHQHPTALGHLEVAHLAAGVLHQNGLGLARHLPDPSALQVGAAERRQYEVSVSAKLRARLAGGRDAWRVYRAARPSG